MNCSNINHVPFAINDILPEAVHRVVNLAKSTDCISGIPTGFAKLDDITSGFQNGELITIAGRPAMGKTAFALSLAKYIACDEKIPTLFFSLKMSNVMLVNHLLSNVCMISGRNIRSGKLQRDEYQRLDMNFKQLLGAPLYIDDTPNMHIEVLSDKISTNVRTNGIKLVIIDYIQLLASSYLPDQTRYEELSEIVRKLKTLARILDIPIIILSQLNIGRLDGKRPQLSDLRDCGSIEDDSDTVLFVHRPEYYHIYQDDRGRDMHGMAQIIIAKHRQGYTSDILLEFMSDYTKFVDLP